MTVKYEILYFKFHGLARLPRLLLDMTGENWKDRYPQVSKGNLFSCSNSLILINLLGFYLETNCSISYPRVLQDWDKEKQDQPFLHIPVLTEFQEDGSKV